MVILENIDIDIDIDKAILQNIDIDKISNRFKFGISNRASHSVMHKQSWLLLLLGPSVHHKSVHQSITNQSISPSQIRSKNSFY